MPDAWETPLAEEGGEVMDAAEAMRSYRFLVAWSEADGEWVATVPLEPSLSWLAPTPVEALVGLAKVLEEEKEMALGDVRVNKPYVPHPWTACDYDDEYDCQEQAVFGVQEVASPRGREIGDGYQACVGHVGEMCGTENWRGSQWRVWTL